MINVGPDADKYKDPLTGEIRDASDQGGTLSTFTAHRSPLGLYFSMTIRFLEVAIKGWLRPRWNRGSATSDPGNGPFFDASLDLLHSH